MVELANEPFARIELDPALREHSPILANLLELYAHDFSEFHSLTFSRALGSPCNAIESLSELILGGGQSHTLLVWQSNLFVSRGMARIGNFSHLNRSVM
jgi:hypothetical protein